MYDDHALYILITCAPVKPYSAFAVSLSALWRPSSTALVAASLAGVALSWARVAARAVIRALRMAGRMPCCDTARWSAVHAGELGDRTLLAVWCCIRQQ